METQNPADTARRVMRAVDRGALATALEGSEGWPYASLVMVACDHDAAPLLLISDLADHTKNIKRDQRVSLLFDGTGDRKDPLTGPRVSVLGRIARTDEPRHRARFLGRHPGAEYYADFKDFHFYRVAVERAHLVAGFGQIHWVEGRDLLYDVSAATILAEAETDILAHVNQDHADTIDLYAQALLGRDGTGWQMTGVDPEGADLRRDGATARLDFPAPVSNPDGVRAVLVSLARDARQRPPRDAA